MEVKKVNRKLRMSIVDIIRYQILTEVMFFKKEYLIQSDLEILTLLVMWGPMELGPFCSDAAKILYPESKPQDLSTRAQNVRNRIVKLEKRNIISKTSTGRKTIVLNPDIEIYSKGNILLDFNYLGIESTQT